MQYLKHVLIVVLQKSIRTYFGATASSFIAVLLKGEMTITGLISVVYVDIPPFRHELSMDISQDLRHRAYRISASSSIPAPSDSN